MQENGDVRSWENNLSNIEMTYLAYQGVKWWVRGEELEQAGTVFTFKVSIEERDTVKGFLLRGNRIKGKAFLFLFLA